MKYRLIIAIGWAALLNMACLLSACSPEPSATRDTGVARAALPAEGSNEVAMDSLGIAISLLQNRAVSFTNKRSAYYYTQTHRNDHDEHAWFAGLNIAQRRVFSGYRVNVGGRVLDPSTAAVTVYPDRMERRYPDGVNEILRMVDMQDVIEVSVHAGGATTTVSPYGDDVALLETRGPVRLYSAIEPRGRVIAAGSSGVSHYLAVADGDQAALALLQQALDNGAGWRAEREARLRGLLNGYRSIVAQDRTLELALRWLAVNMDQLVTQQRGEGIYAGLPWFNEYWGRDSFIALPGALLVTGEFETARAVLRSFATFMDMDPASRYYGRVPNIVRPDELNYHTTDGTPRFVIALHDYVRYSGDASIVAELYPNIRASIEGALTNWTDEYGYLTHESNETWMDARRASDLQAYSPRDTRANDIQALWHGQLQAGVYFAQVTGDGESMQRWRAIAQKLAAAFQRDFTSAEHNWLADRLDTQDQADFSLRPNQFYALGMIDDQQTVARATLAAWENLVYPWGVASLAASDPFFHPFHKAWDHYHKDEAYHNGTIWLWNNGIAMQRMIELGQLQPAWELFTNMNRQSLTLGVVGGMAENMDAYPQTGTDWPRLTGTYLQAWSNSEQLRAWYQHFLGIRPDMIDGTVTLAPRLPAAAGPVHFRARVGEGFIDAEYDPREEGNRYSWRLAGFDARLRIDLAGFENFDIDVADGDRLLLQFESPQRVAWRLSAADDTERQAGTLSSDANRALTQSALDKLFEGVTFARPGDPRAHAVMQQVYDNDEDG